MKAAPKKSGEPVRKVVTCESLLADCEMFQKVPPPLLKKIANLMELQVFRRNDVLLKQDAPSDRFFLVESGEIIRKYINPDDGKNHTVEYAIKAKSINSMKVLSGDPVYATVKCISNECRMYEMRRDVFLELLSSTPEIATKIAEGLCEEVRHSSRKYRTPILEQTQQEVNVPAVAIAAGIESYYRSALNAILNARLTGVKSDLFPNMHIQVPTRIAYIVSSYLFLRWRRRAITV
jgi:signal-transduction protein with cAMP-binding, CBS, and nucleotidyltransferase domain